MQALVLSPRQQRVVATAITLLATVAIVAVLYQAFALLARFVARFSPVLTPLAVAAILALILRPYYDRLRTWCRWPWLAMLALLLSVALPFGLLTWKFGALLVEQLRGLAGQLPVWIERLSIRIESWLPQMASLWEAQGDHVREGLRERGGWLATQVAHLVQRLWSAGVSVFQVVGGLLSWVVLPVYTVFLLAARPWSVDRIEGLLPFLKPETRNDVTYLAREFVNILVAFFRGQLLVAGAQGILFATGFGFIGLSYGVALGLALGFLNIIPYLGNLVGLAVALPLAFFQPGGGWSLLAAVLAVCCAVQLAEAYVLTPRIMGQRTGLHPMAIIFSLFFWGTALDGILGMILGIPLTAFLVVFWRLLKTKYIRELV